MISSSSGSVELDRLQLRAALLLRGPRRLHPLARRLEIRRDHLPAADLLGHADPLLVLGVGVTDRRPVTREPGSTSPARSRASPPRRGRRPARRVASPAADPGRDGSGERCGLALGLSRRCPGRTPRCRAAAPYGRARARSGGRPLPCRARSGRRRSGRPDRSRTRGRRPRRLGHADAASAWIPTCERSTPSARSARSRTRKYSGRAAWAPAAAGRSASASQPAFAGAASPKRTSTSAQTRDANVESVRARARSPTGSRAGCSCLGDPFADGVVRIVHHAGVTDGVTTDQAHRHAVRRRIDA